MSEGDILYCCSLDIRISTTAEHRLLLLPQVRIGRDTASYTAARIREGKAPELISPLLYISSEARKLQEYGDPTEGSNGASFVTPVFLE